MKRFLFGFIMSLALASVGNAQDFGVVTDATGKPTVKRAGKQAVLEIGSTVMQKDVVKISNKSGLTIVAYSTCTEWIVSGEGEVAVENDTIAPRKGATAKPGKKLPGCSKPGGIKGAETHAIGGVTLFAKETKAPDQEVTEANKQSASAGSAVAVASLKPPKDESKASSETKEMKSVVLMPLRATKEIPRDEMMQYEAALVKSLSGQYVVYSGDRVKAKVEEVYQRRSSETKAGKECDETKCVQDVAMAFQTELVAIANIRKSEGGYSFSITINDVIEDRAVFANNIPCKNCDEFRLMSMIQAQALTGGQGKTDLGGQTVLYTIVRANSDKVEIPADASKKIFSGVGDLYPSAAKLSEPGCANDKQCIEVAARSGADKLVLVSVQGGVKQDSLGSYKGTLTTEVNEYNVKSRLRTKNYSVRSEVVSPFSRDQIDWNLAADKLVESKKLNELTGGQ